MTRKRWNRFTKWWLLWGAAFAVIEGMAVAQRGDHPGGTLSSLVWRFTEHPAQRILFGVGWCALSLHFLVHRRD